MNLQPRNNGTQPQPNPLGVIFFIFGALHIYSLLRNKNRKKFQQKIGTGSEIFRPVWRKILAVVLFGTTCLEAIEILETSLP